MLVGRARMQFQPLVLIINLPGFGPPTHVTAGRHWNLTLLAAPKQLSLPDQAHIPITYPPLPIQQAPLDRVFRNRAQEGILFPSTGLPPPSNQTPTPSESANLARASLIHALVQPLQAVRFPARWLE